MASISRFFSRSQILQRFALKQQISRSYADAVGVTSGMDFTFASPSEAFYANSREVKQIDVPTGSGAIGVLANHVPTLGVLAPGVLTVYEDGGESKKFFVSSGSYTVNEDSSVVITAEEAVPLDHLDKDAARNNLSQALNELTAATTDVAKAEAQIAIDCNQAIIDA